MPRKPNIPFGDKRRTELNRINRNVRNKQKTLAKRFDGMQADFTIKSAADFTSIKEYNQYIAEAKHFTKRTANKFDLVNPDNGTRISFTTLSKVEKAAKRINRIKDREFNKIKDLPHMELGRATGLTIGENFNKKIGFADPKFENFRHLEFRPKDMLGNRDAKLILKKLDDSYKGDFIGRRDQQYFQNYIQSLHTRFNKSPHPFGLQLSDDIWNIIDALLDMGQDDFMRLYYQGKIPNVPFIYGLDEEETILSELKEAFGV